MWLGNIFVGCQASRNWNTLCILLESVIVFLKQEYPIDSKDGIDSANENMDQKNMEWKQ